MGWREVRVSKQDIDLRLDRAVSICCVVSGCFPLAASLHQGPQIKNRMAEVFLVDVDSMVESLCSRLYYIRIRIGVLMSAGNSMQLLQPCYVLGP